MTDTKQASYTAPLVIPLDRFERELDRELAEAYWSDNTDEVEVLQKRMQSVKTLRDLGENYWTAF